jgi:transketolase
MSDGEMQEGSNWEALMFGGYHKLGNLVVVIDHNNLQSLATVDKTLDIYPLEKKLQSFGWLVKNVNGHDHNALKECLGDNFVAGERPTAIIAKTTKGKGVSFMENKVEWHYRSPTEKELREALAEIENA